MALGHAVVNGQTGTNPDLPGPWVGCRPDDRRRRWPGHIAVAVRDDRRERTRQRLAMLRPALVKHIGRCATEMASFGVNGA